MTRAGNRGAPWDEALADAVISAHVDERGPLLVLLHALQDAFGYIDDRAVPLLAQALNLSRAEVRGVISFYADLRTQPPGSSVVQICRAEACQSMGAERLAAYATNRLGVDFGGTTPDRSVTLEQVFCLGNCALSPAVMVDGRLVGRVDEARFEELLSPAAGP
jgi:formate dehydrogenase subunit gamma